MVGILTETSTTQQLTKMYVKQSHLVVISKGWPFTKENIFVLASKNCQAFFQSQHREFQCQDIKLATLKVLWNNPDHFIIYAVGTIL